MPIAPKETAFAKKSLEFEKKIIFQKIGQMSNLPTPGEKVMKVMLLLRDEDVVMKELIDAISQDQSLVARILKLINSGYYGLRKTIDSVDRAVNLLGILKIKQVVYSASIMDIFSKDEAAEWNHAYSCSVLMASIMEEHEIPAASNLPLTILMHDIGKVILRRFSPKKYTMAIDLAAREKCPIYKAEENVIYISHAEAGSWLLEKWDMTDDIFKPIGWHHSPDVPAEFVVETALLQFVNWVDCSARGVACDPPSRELMAAAGFEEIDNEYWVNYQRSLIAEIENGPEDKKNEGQEGAGSPAAQAASGDLPPPAEDSGYVKTSTEKLAKQKDSKKGVVSIPDEPKDIPLPRAAPQTGDSSTRKIPKSAKEGPMERTRVYSRPKKKNFFRSMLDAIMGMFR